MECKPLGTSLHAAISQSPKRNGRLHREKGLVGDMPKQPRQRPRDARGLHAMRASQKTRPQVGEITCIGSSYATAFLLRQLAFAHQSHKARQKGCCVEICACFNHGEYQGKLPHLAEDVSCLQRDA
eukprot:5603668-Pleurochrysis_carterae.AAC.1